MDETDKLVEAISGVGATISDEDQAYQIQLQEALYASSSMSQYIPNQAMIEHPSLLCTICMESNDGADELLRLPCSHGMCRPCLTTYIKTKVEEKVRGGRILCVVPGCGQDLEHHVYRRILPAQVQEAWERVLAEDQIPLGQRVYCPFPDCSALLMKEEEEGEGEEKVGSDLSIHSYKKKEVKKKKEEKEKKKKKEKDSVMDVECPYCHRLFCLACMVPWHANLTCLHFQTNLTHHHTNPNPNPNPNSSIREDLLLHSLAKEKKWRSCSNCKHIIELNQGCMHITCRCGNEFCYKCGEKWTSNSHICKSKKHG